MPFVVAPSALPHALSRPRVLRSSKRSEEPWQNKRRESALLRREGQRDQKGSRILPSRLLARLQQWQLCRMLVARPMRVRKARA